MNVMIDSLHKDRSTIIIKSKNEINNKYNECYIYNIYNIYNMIITSLFLAF